MHGFNHIAGNRRHWMERVFWALITGCAIWGAVDVSLGQLQRYNENPTVVTLEKDFRNWKFTYPAITVCFEDKVDPIKLPNAIESNWNVSLEDPKYEYYAKFVMTVANSDLLHLEGYQDFSDESLEVDFVKLVYSVMPELQMKPTWSEGVMPAWFPVMTERGACYITNSVATGDAFLTKVNPNDTKTFPLHCLYASLNCYVMLEVSTTTDFFAHSPYDVMDITMQPSHVMKTLNRIVELSVASTGTGRGVRELGPARRRCLYSDEPAAAGRTVYSDSICTHTCRSKLSVKLCGCRPFYYFYEADGPICPLSGMRCLAGHAARLARDGAACACAQQCMDAVFKEMTVTDEFWDKGTLANRGAVKYTIQAPRTRYTREIVFHFQDLVVSFGGAAGLFLGASFISIIEIFYFIFAKIMGCCIGNGQGSAERQVKVIKVKPSYEENRMKELTLILEDQKRYGHVKMYPY